ncbi:arf-GAP with Rho-GAP domain, ANK repeat and PH domain-containing protein 3 isoform X2 [Carettochelys insculpta]|uniref:arf-GAP with Rho-GAP domain, ANK repeat and PH domain-containing protein 3 isoform X2 n=1 Tax=Carettochelys insculpta TaxID=44489 RepID=UPI003EB7D571
MLSSCDADIADWLATIHLERYQESFRQHGYHLARDAVSLGNAELQQMGVTATGHRKRILNLVQQMQLLVRDKGGPLAGDACAKAGPCTGPLGVPRVYPADQQDRGTSSANGASLAATDVLGNQPCLAGPNPAPPLETEPASHIAKPVPKPRTLFQRPSPAVRSEQRLAPTPAAQTSVPTYKPSSEGPSASSTVPGESAMDLGCSDSPQEQPDSSVGLQVPRPGGADSGLEPVPEPRAGVGAVGVENVDVQAGCGKPFPHLGGGTQPTARSPASPRASSPLSAASALGGPAQLTAAWGSVEMVSNVIYEGLMPPAQPAGCSGGEELARSRPTPRPLDLATQQETTLAVKPDSPGRPSLDLPPIPQRPAGRPEPVEEPISPYCEGVFGRGLPAREQKSTGTPAGSGCRAVPEIVPGLEKERPRTSSEGSSEDTEPESWAQRTGPVAQDEMEGYASVEALQAEGGFSLPAHLYPDEVLDDLTISPYASFTSLSEHPPPVLSGWLDKLSPQGNYVFQRRFVKFNGKNFMYFHSEKDPYPKGVIPLSIIEMAQATKENKFHLVTSQRVFVFRAENEAQRNEWCSTLQRKVAEQRLACPQPRLARSASCQKCGPLELKGQKSRLFAALSLADMWLYKNEQFFKMGIAICLIELQGTTIREAKNRSFELVSPSKVFSFVAESEREKREWMEALQEAIAETLYDYEVAEKIWSNKANKFCADCRSLNPDWASINLCVVICKQCAGQHRSLGSSVSKVQSLKLDTSVWSNEIVQLFIVLGNEQANRFWAGRLPPTEALYPDASTEERRLFVARKYREGQFRLPHPQHATQEEVLQALCAAVAGPGLLKTVLQFFSAPEAGPATEAGGYRGAQGSEVWQSPESSWQGSHPGNAPGQVLSPEGVYNEIAPSVALCGYLYKAPALAKPAGSRKSRDELQRIWCSLEKSLLFYETDKSAEPLGKVELADVVSLGVSSVNGPASPGPTDRFRFSLDLFLSGDRMQQLGANGPDTLQAWASAIGKWFTPLSCHCLLAYEFQRVGRMRYRSMLSPDQWLQGFFILQKGHLFLCPGQEGAAEDSINLRRLQELSVVPHTEAPEKKEVLILVEMGRTFYLQGVSQLDFAAWCTDIQASAGGRGNALRDQQLSRTDIPIIVDSCIAFITQYGLRHEGLYRKNGAKSRIKVLMEQFRRDARNVKLRSGDHFLEDVTDVLKRFFRELEDPVFTAELHPQWQEAAAIAPKPHRLERYKELINRLPRLNRRTLAALIGHLYRVQKCADFNHMSTKNLALLFAPSLFQTDGKGEHEVKVMEDLIDSYVRIFNIDEEQVSQMELENSLITTWRDVQLSQAGDLILEVYLEQKLPDCCVTLKVSPSMTAEELTNHVLEMRNVSSSLDIWLTFEALENGELERPLHPKEKVLEQALQWCKLLEPSTAYLLVRKVPIGEGSCLFTGAKRPSPKCGPLRCREEPPKLLGCKFQERYFVVQDHRLLQLKEKRSARPEREWPLDQAKVYMGIRKKLKPPSQWGFTLVLDKLQLSLVCAGQAELWDWTTSILKAQHDDLHPVILRRRSSCDLTKQKFGTMPLIPLQGDSTDATMLSANQTLPMKMHQDSVEEQQEVEAEPVYEEVGGLPAQDGGRQLEPGQVPAVDRSKKPALFPGWPLSSEQRGPGTPVTKSISLERGLNLEPDRAPEWDRAPGLRDTQTASLERHMELPHPWPALGQELRPALLPLAPATIPEPLQDSARKRSVQLPSPASERLMQELSTILLKKNECQVSSPGQQVT